MATKEETKKLNMKVIIHLPKEVIDYFDKFGIRCDEIDGSRYYNNNQWIRVDESGVVTMEDFKDLPDSVKEVHLKFINQPQPSIDPKQQSIAFAEFFEYQGYERSNEDGLWSTVGGETSFTTEQLHELFTQSIK